MWIVYGGLLYSLVTQDFGLDYFSVKQSKKEIAFVWDQFGPYHVDRCNAAARSCGVEYKILGCQIVERSEVYAWSPTREAKEFHLTTLFDDIEFESTRWFARLFRLIIALRKSNVVFLAGYQRADIFLFALLSRLRGIKVYLMMASKFEDKPRYLSIEFIKKILLTPYHGAIVGGHLQKEYVQFLGMKARTVVLGYNTVDLARVRRGAVNGGVTSLDFAERDFVVVTRLVAKKNLKMLFNAYKIYCDLSGASARRLKIVGDGPLRQVLQAQVEYLRIAHLVDWEGFLQADEVSTVLSRGLAILLPSVEEQWGLVVNEALAFELPVVISDRVGARNTLARCDVNGYIIETDNALGWARAMFNLSSNQVEWSRFVAGSKELAWLADSARFGTSVHFLAGQH